MASCGIPCMCSRSCSINAGLSYTHPVRLFASHHPQSYGKLAAASGRKASGRVSRKCSRIAARSLVTVNVPSGKTRTVSPGAVAHPARARAAASTETTALMLFNTLRTGQVFRDGD